MQTHRNAIEEWCSEIWGQEPKEILEWFCDSEFVQVFVKLQRSVLIVDFTVDENELKIKNHLHVPLDIWNPGSIQVNRINDGRVRFRHRNSEIILAAELRAPEWGKTVLEDWLLALKGESVRPKDRAQRLAGLRRTREIIERNLNAASLDNAGVDLELINLRISSAEVGLNPFELNESE